MVTGALIQKASDVYDAVSSCTRFGIQKRMASSGQLIHTQDTYQDHQVPLIYRENYIHSGYRRPDQPYSYYAWSFFQLHNESINVWSHCLALALFILKAYRMREEVDYWHDPLALAIVVFALGSICYSCFSSFAHLFQSQSRVMHYTCFQIDYIGIAMNGYGNACLLYYMTGTKAFYGMVSAFFMPVNALLSVLVFVCFSTAKLRYRRPYPFQRKLWQITSCLLHLVFGATPMLYNIYECVTNECDEYSRGSIIRHLEYTFWFFVSSFFFASHIPERFAPGKFDIVGHGHQVFHVVMTYTTLLQYETALEEYKTRPRDLVSLSAPRAMEILGGAAVILLVDVLLVVLSYKYRHAKVLDDLEHEKRLEQKSQ